MRPEEQVAAWECRYNELKAATDYHDSYCRSGSRAAAGAVPFNNLRLSGVEDRVKEIADADATHRRTQLKAENEELFEMSQRDRRALEVCRLQRMTAEATMREVAEELRSMCRYEKDLTYHAVRPLADRLDPRTP